VACLVWLAAAVGAHFAEAQTLSGSSLALRSVGSGAGDWTLNRNGYVGTYIRLALPGSVSIGVNASGTAAGGINPHMNIVIADTKAGFDVAGGFNHYEHTFDLPAGTYLVRTEFNNDLEQSNRSITVRDLTVTGATVLNASTSSNALAAADSYIQNFRQGRVTIGLSGAAPGTLVDVKLNRHAFNFGTAVPRSSSDGVNNYLGTSGTARQTNYQARLNQNFNALVPENAGKWDNNERIRDIVTMTNVDQILDYAQTHNMRARMHNLLWGDNSFNGQQPSWVLSGNSTTGLLDQAYLGTNPNAAADLRQEISERIDYYVGTGTTSDRAHKYVELDVYNESFHTGQDPGLPENLKHNYWNVYDTAGIADIYREARDRIAAAGSAAKVFVNEYGVLGSGNYGNWYVDHIEELRHAGVTAELGDVVGGIGVQHYPGESQNAGNIMRTLQNLAVQGLPIALTEFGVSSGVSESTAANILGDILRLTFGTAEATGFFMWGFHQESGSGATTLFAPSAALYTVNTSDFNNWTITEAGERWQDLLGISDWDGDPENGWTTQLTATVDENGAIHFDGFWGDYELTIGGQTHPLMLSKGIDAYSLAIAPGDYNGDRVVDAADYVVWRSTRGSTADFRADGNGDGQVDDADYQVWRSLFGMIYTTDDSEITNVPEPSNAIALFLGCLNLFCRARRPKFLALVGGSAAMAACHRGRTRVAANALGTRIARCRRIASI
jgi:GH35 family endo-1,4-beta-xylanase